MERDKKQLLFFSILFTMFLLFINTFYLFVLSVAAEQTESGKRIFWRCSLLRVNITNMNQVEAILKIREEMEDQPPPRKVVIFDDVIIPNRRPIKMLVTPETTEIMVEKIFHEANISYHILERDGHLMQMNEYRFNDNYKTRYLEKIKEIGDGDPIAPSYFLDYSEIHPLFHWWSTLRPDIATFFYTGRSYENRLIVGIQINGHLNHLPIIYIDAGIDASVWMAPATAIYIAHKLIFGKDELSTRLRSNYQWYIVPTVNPDGYEYSRNHDRFWRKTRTPYGDNNCYGVDINKNFNASWGRSGTSQDPCSDRYAGPEPFSELETVAMRDTIIQLIWGVTPCDLESMRALGRVPINGRPGLLAYFSLQGHGQLIQAPWSGRDMIKPEDYDYLYKVGTTGRDAAQSTPETAGKFRFGTAPDLKYPMSGSAIDWVKHNTSVKWTYAFDLLPDPDSVTFPLGVITRPTAVHLSGRQVLNAIGVMLDEIIQGPVVDLLEMYGGEGITKGEGLERSDTGTRPKEEL